MLLSNHHTSATLIGNGLLALLRHPDQLERIRSDPSIRPAAVHELLRYETPGPFLNRIVMRDDRFAGADLREGNTVVLAIGAANRDPRRFDRPDELDLVRPDSDRHLSFGGGAHHPLAPGDALAQHEARVALGMLLERCAGLRLADEQPRYRRLFALRRLEALPVAFHTAAR